MRSSRLSNYPKPFLGVKALRARSVILAGGGVAFGVIPQMIFQTSSTAWLVASMFGPLVLSELAFGGGKPFPDYNLERIKVGLRKMLRANVFRSDIKERAGTMFSFKPDKNILESPGGAQIYGYVLIPDSENQAEFYQSFYADLLQTLPYGVIIKDAVFSKPYTNEYLKNYRPALLEKGICEQKRYLFVTIEPTCDPNDKRILLEKLSIGTRRLKAKEIAAYMEFVAAPQSPPSGRDTPHYQVSQVIDGRHIRLYPEEKYQAAISLCALPARVNETYNEILATALTGHTVITTTFKLREGLRDAFKKMILGIIRTSKMDVEQSSEEKKTREEEKNQLARGDAIELHMYQSILTYDTTEALMEKTLKLQNIRTYLGLSEQYAPLYMADTGFVEKSFEAAMPFSWSYLPQRLQDVNSRREASYYLPIPAEDVSATFSPIVFRTTRNTPYYIDNQTISDRVLIIIAGDTGTGKSTLVAEYTRAQFYLESIGVDTGFVSIDVGGSNSWLKEEEGVLIFDLDEVDENGEVMPFPIHPLHCTLDPTKAHHTSDEKAIAVMQLVKLMGLQSYQAIAETVVLQALEKTLAHSKVYRLSTFKHYFEEFFLAKKKENFFTKEVTLEWENALATLGKFSKGGIYGHIFDPEEPIYQSLGDFHKLYFNAGLKMERIKDLMKAFFELAYMVGYSVCLKSDSESGQYRLFNFIVDEFQKQARFIDPREILDLKNQARKNGFLPIITVQSLKHLILNDLPKDQQGEIYEGIREVYFGNIDFSTDRAKLATMLGIEDDPSQPVKGKLKECADTVAFNQRIITERKSALASPEKTPIIVEKANTYSIGYISQIRSVHSFYVDLESGWLWYITTHAAARELRLAVMRYFGITKKEAARLLNLKFGKNIPTKKLTQAELKEALTDLERYR